MDEANGSSTNFWKGLGSGNFNAAAWGSTCWAWNSHLQRRTASLGSHKLLVPVSSRHLRPLEGLRHFNSKGSYCERATLLSRKIFCKALHTCSLLQSSSPDILTSSPPHFILRSLLLLPSFEIILAVGFIIPLLETSANLSSRGASGAPPPPGPLRAEAKVLFC